MAKCFFKLLHRADDIETLPRAAWAAYNAHTAGAQAQGFEDFIADAHFFFRLSRQADADGVADASPQQVAHANRRFDRSANKPASLGNAEMQRAIDRVGQPHIGGNREEYVRRLYRNLKLMEIMVLQQLDMVQCAFNQRLGARLAIFLQQVFFETSGIYTDADRAAICLGGVDDLFYALGRANIARIDPQTGRACVRCLKRAFVMKMDIGNDGHIGGADNLLQRGGALHIRAGHPNDIDACILAAADLVNRCGSIAGKRVRHRLHRNRRIAADRDITNHDLAGRTARNIAPRTNRRHFCDIGGLAFSRNHHRARLHGHNLYVVWAIAPRALRATIETS